MRHQWKNLPELLFVENRSCLYRKGYRHLESWDKGNDICLLSRARDGLKGKVCWVCLDVANGNPDVDDGKVYVWIFNTQDEALKQFKLHKDNPKFTQLRAPVRCVIVDSFKF